MPSCWEEALSAAWIGLTGHYRLTYEDKALEAGEGLQRLMDQLERREQTLQATRATSAEEALALRGSKDGRARCRAKVLEHRRLTAQLERLQGYRDTVAQHMDALQNTELNKSLISTLQQSSKTLRSLGIDDGVKQAEAVITNVHESMASIHQLTSALGVPMAMSDLTNDEDLEHELDLLLGDARDEPPLAAPPAAPASMLREDAPAPAPAFLEVGLRQ